MNPRLVVTARLIGGIARGRGETATLSGTTLTVGHSGIVDNGAAGSLILTDHGEVAVENLTEGDRIITVQNGGHVPMPVTWMRHRSIDVANHPSPNMVAPVRTRAGAFGDGVPRRGLPASPAHAILVDGELMPADLLINHMTITQELEARQVTYYHMELEWHSVVLAEGLPPESYLDTDSRAFFANAGSGDTSHPEFQVNAGLKTWQDDACALLAVDAEIIAPIWAGLAARAEQLGHESPRSATSRCGLAKTIWSSPPIIPASHKAGTPPKRMTAIYGDGQLAAEPSRSRPSPRPPDWISSCRRCPLTSYRVTHSTRSAWRLEPRNTGSGRRCVRTKP